VIAVPGPVVRPAAPTLIRFPISATIHPILVGLPVFTFSAADSPAISRAAAALATAEIITRGKGRSYVVTVDPEAAGVIWQQCLLAEGDADRSKTVGAGLRAIIARINAEVRAAGYTYPSTVALPQRRTFTVPVGPAEVRRNRVALPAAKHWSGSDHDLAVIGGPGEPTRTAADMRVAVADLIERYLARWPFGRPVHQEAIVIASAAIVADRYPHPCSFSVTRAVLRIYLDNADDAR